MHWSYAHIDWESTAVLLQAGLMGGMVAFGLAFTLADPNVQSNIRKAGRALKSRYGLLGVSALFGVLWLIVVAVSDNDGITGQTAAAWVQAVGSVAAIVAAIWIDQGEARRLRGERKAIDEAAAAARLVGILNAAVALREAAADIREQAATPHIQMRLRLEHERQLQATARVLTYHLAQNVELNPGTLEGLALADEILRVTLIWAFSHQPFSGENGALEFMDVLERAADELGALVADISRETVRF